MTDLATVNRMRSGIIGYLELASSFERQARYQDAAPHINVASEVINQWEDWVHEGWRSYVAEPVFSLAEVQAVAKFYTAWETVVAATPDCLPPLEALLASGEWQFLASQAGKALIIFQARGDSPDTSGADWQSIQPSPASQMAPAPELPFNTRTGGSSKDENDQ